MGCSLPQNRSCAAPVLGPYNCLDTSGWENVPRLLASVSGALRRAPNHRSSIRRLALGCGVNLKGCWKVTIPPVSHCRDAPWGVSEAERTVPTCHGAPAERLGLRNGEHRPETPHGASLQWEGTFQTPSEGLGDAS